MAENEVLEQNTPDESDIFEWFASDEQLIQDVHEFEQNQSKDIYDYANIAWNSFKIMNLIILLLLLVSGIYLYIQKNESFSELAIFNPICNILLWDVELKSGSCASVSYAYNQFTTNLENTKSEQFLMISDIIQPLYLSTDFINSWEVVFLYDKSKSRLKPSQILEEFDRLRNEFETADKSALECWNIEIKDNQFSAKCDVYSSDWDRSIVLPNGEKSQNAWGTSISIASSFLDYIQNNSSLLQVSEKPNYFSAENISGENGGYTKKTTFFLQLEYNNSILSL